MIINRYKKSDNMNFIDSIGSNFYLIPFDILEYLLKRYDSIFLLKNCYNFIKKNKQRYIIKKETNKFIEYFFNNKIPPLFSSIELETINRCNGICEFCPVNRRDDTRKFKLMDEVLFKSIIKQLKDLNYNGRLAFHSNNEPFMDKRIVDFVKYAKQNLPKAYIYLYTNGTLLTMDKFLNIIPYLSKIYIDNYNDDLKLNENSRAINDYCIKNKSINSKVEIHLRKIHEVLNTRGGQSPNNHKKEILNMSCVLPFKQLVIRPDGKISLCCNDPLGKFTLGDLNKQSLIEIWNSKKYNIIRNKLKRGRKYIYLCKYCDTLPGPSGY